MTLTQRALILRQHGHTHQEIAALLDVEVAAVAAAEKDPSGSPLLAGSGGAAPEVKDLAGIFTEAAGFTVVDSGGFYIDGNHLVVLWAKIIHAASLAVVAEQTVVAGSFVGEVAPLAFGYEVTPAWVYSGGFKAAEVSVDANLTFMAYASASAAADVQFGLYNTRWPLADPDAARAFVAAL